MLLCRICGEKRATTRHVQSHGLTYEEYLQEYETERYYKKKAIESINELYVTVRHKFAEMKVSADRKAFWVTTAKGLDRQYGLIDRDIQEHLEGRKTLGVYVPKYKTKFISFDIDKPDPEVLENVVNAIGSYVPESHIYCSWSGNKGYHVDVFFDRLVEKSVVHQFYLLILADTGYSSNLVECFGSGGQPVKIPLGFNHKNKDPKTDYCCFVNKHGREIKDDQHGYSYISKITKTNADWIYEAVEVNYSPDFLTDDEVLETEELTDTTKTLSIYNADLNIKRESAEKLIKNGLFQEGQRHQSLYKIAVYLKDKGYEEHENKDFLNKWIDEKCDPDLYKSSEAEIRNDIEYTVNSIYRHDYKLKTRARKVTLNKMELKEVLSVTNKTLRKLYFILFTHCKAFADDSGEFYMTYEQMSEAGAIKNDRAALLNQIIKLEKMGKVAIVQRNVRAKGKRNNTPNWYRVKAYQPGTVLDVKCFEPCENITEHCLSCASCELMNPKEIRKSYGRYSKEVLSSKCSK